MPNMNTHVLVTNLNGTSSRWCQCGPWIQHHRYHSGQRRRTCSILGCTNLAEVGGHVRTLDGRTTREHWIIPMCRGCNKRTDDMWVDSRTELVSANTQAMGCYY